MVVGENLKQVRIRSNITLFTVSKILNTYPGGEFDVYHSENRAADDR